MIRFVPCVKTLPVNLSGRDFVVGDIHGCLSDLLLLLNEVQFDKTKDRLLSVGDLADRGPQSWGALSLLTESWFYAVKGNHEDLLLDHIRKSGIAPMYAPCDFINNGGGWYYEKSSRPDNASELLDLVAELPHLLSVEDPDTGFRFHVVHGELSTFMDGHWHLFGDKEIDQWRAGQSSEVPVDEFDILWERTIFSSGGKNLPIKSPALSPTFCGHSIVQDITMRASHIKLDTGAFKKYRKDPPEKARLTMVEALPFLQEAF